MTIPAIKDLLSATQTRPDRYGNITINTTSRVFTPNQIQAILLGAPVPDNEYLWGVPYISQEGAGASRYRNDCGPACVAMLLSWQGLPTPPVDVLSAETGLRTADIGLTTRAIVDLGNAHGLKLAVSNSATPAFIRSELAAGRPVIPLISYAPLSGRLNQADMLGHFLVVTGYDATSYFVNDPDWYTKVDKTAEDGHHWRIPKAEFEQAIAASPVPNQACVVLPTVAPPSVYAQGIDISHWQTVTDMTALANAYDFIIMKASQGTTGVDPNFAQWRVALKGKVLLGAYHFLTGTDPRVQAKHFAVDVVGADGSIALFADFELNPDGPSATADQLDIFVDEVERLTGKVCGIYTRANLIPAGDRRFTRAPLWVASYNATPTIPPGWATWSIQQYNNGKTGPQPYNAPGITGAVDHDRYNGDKTALAAFWPTISGSVGAPPVPPETVWTTYYVDSSFPLGINIHTLPGANTPIYGDGTGFPNGAEVHVDVASLTNGYVKEQRGGWIAMQYLSPTKPVPPTGTGIWGLNTDPANPLGNPAATTLAGLSMVRLVLKVSDKSWTLAQAFNFYDPIIDAYNSQGIKVNLIISQSAISQGMPYPGTGNTWQGYTPIFTAFLQQVVAHYGAKVWAYEIWNEPDMQGAQTSVYVPAADFGRLLRASYATVNGAAKVISGGLASGDPVSYIQGWGDISRACDYIGIHPYGKTVPGLLNIPGSNTGLLSTYLDKLIAAFPSKPLAITEYGFSGAYTADPANFQIMADYMKQTFALLRNSYAGKVMAAIWFAWSDAMAEAGIVLTNQTPKAKVYPQFFANVALDRVTPAPVPPQPEPIPPAADTARTRIGLHIGTNAPGQQLLDMAKRCYSAGKPMACVVVISNAGLSEQLAPYTKVVSRFSDDRERYDPSQLDGLTPQQALDYGKAFYFGELHGFTDSTPHSHYIKMVNEKGFHAVVGNEFWIGMMQAAESDVSSVNPNGRRLAIYGDSMSSVTPQAWQARLPSLRYAMQHGHVVTINAYGPTKQDGTGDNKPVSTQAGFIYFGGWPIQLYEATPADARPPVIIGETGSSDSTVPRAFDVAQDAAAYDKMLRAYPYIVGFNYFTVGQWPTYPAASLDYAIPAFEQAILAN